MPVLARPQAKHKRSADAPRRTAVQTVQPGRRATASKPTATNIGKAFAALLPDYLAGYRLWVREESGHLDLWLLTPSISHEQRLDLYRLQVSLRAQFPKAEVELHITYPGLYELEGKPFEFVPPRGALSIESK